MIRRYGIGLAAILVAWAVTLWMADRLPDTVATHWGMSGQPDDWSSKAVLVLWLPLLYVGLALLLMVLPRLDPRRREVAHNAPTYALLMNAVMVVLAVAHVAVVGYNLGWPIRINTIVFLLVGALLIVIGNVMPRMRPNWFMGIRTPWTLSSERVWRRTHRVGGVCIMTLGIAVVALGLGWSPAGPAWLIGLVVVAALVPIGYSYFAWRREHEAPSTGGKGVG